MRRRFLRTLFAAALAVSLLAVPVSAQEETVEEPVYEAITFYLHGTENVGELDATSLGHMPMDTVAPTGSSSKSRGITNYVRGPNSKCSGNWLLPTWDGFMSGRVEGDVRVVLNTLTHPGASFTVELFADGGGGCNDAYVEPVAAQDVAFPAGAAETAVVFEDVQFDVGGQLTLMVRAPSNPVAGQPTSQPHQGRVYYDSVAQASRVELQCLLPEGKTTCVY